jgi:putative nucleotidyltransferase with HDIG domain
MMDISYIINKVSDLPALPEVVIQLNYLLKDSSSSIDNVAGIIEKDAALSSKVLRLANSSYYGLASQVDSVSRAIIVLGFNTVCNVVTAVGVSAIFKDPKKDACIDMAGLWLHTLGCAVSSKAVMRKKSDPDAEKAFVCGVLHDIGKVLIAKTIPEEQKKISGLLLTGEHKTLIEAEIKVLGFSHTEIGHAIAKKWHFPDYILEVIKYHHQPFSAKLAPDIVAAVHLGNSLAKAMALGLSTEPRVTLIEPSAWKRLGIREADIPSLAAETQQEFDLAMDFWMLD